MMNGRLKKRIKDIVDDRLSAMQMEELIEFLRETLPNKTGLDDESFYKNLAKEMKREVKELALMLIEFRKDLRAKVHPDIDEIATKYIPQATDELEAIIESTEVAAHKIMDNLENMQGLVEKMKDLLTSLREGQMTGPTVKKGGGGGKIVNQAAEKFAPVIDIIEAMLENYMSLISDSFVQMSFQDLTGQRIKRTINLVSQMEQRIKRMVISLGLKLSEKEKNPGISDEELQRAVDDNVTALAPPQNSGKGLDQKGIDELLASL